MITSFKELYGGIWRCAIDRFEQEIDAIRVELIRQKTELDITQLRKIAVEGQPEGIEWWNPEHQYTMELTKTKFQEALSLEKDEPITEGMVYWLQITEQSGITTVLRATISARALAKDLYKKLLTEDTGFAPEDDNSK